VGGPDDDDTVHVAEACETCAAPGCAGERADVVEEAGDGTLLSGFAVPCDVCGTW
jgi:hypothetical protein